MAECVEDGALSIDDGTLRLDTAGAAPVVLIDETIVPSYYSFDHNSRPTSVDRYVKDVTNLVTEIPADREYYLLATLDVGQSSMGVTSRNGIFLELRSEVVLSPTEYTGDHAEGDAVWAFGGRYDAGTNFIWRNQGVIETHHPAVTVDVPVISGPYDDVTPHKTVTGTGEFPGNRWVRFSFYRIFQVIGWNDGVGGEAPVNFFDTPEVRMRLWAFPVVS